MKLFRQPAGSRTLSRQRARVFGRRMTLLVALLLAGDFSQPARAAEARDNASSWRMVGVPADATNGLGAWIWAQKTSDKQICHLWRSFEIPRGTKVSRALVKITADNGYRLLLDGRELGQGTEWRALTEYDVTQLLSPGTHTLAVIAFNDFLEAGVIFGLRAELSDGRVIQVKSDESWRVVPNDEPAWETRKEASADWAKVKIVAASSTLWWTDRPLDFVVVPPFKPMIIPFWHRGWFHFTLILFCGLIFIACLWLLAELLVQNKEHRLLNLERARIARDIHDDVGTRLTKLVLQGEVAQSTQPANSEVRGQLDQICGGLREVLGAMDEVLWAVNPRHDTLANFIAYICDYAQTYLQSTKIQCRLEVEPDIPPLNFDLPLRRSLLLVVKEALNNAAKHSKADRLTLKIHRAGQKLVVVVDDNGCGFDLAHARQDRNGLTNIFQRMNEAGGECRIVTRPGAGCRVELSIPLTRRPSRNWFSDRHRPPEHVAVLLQDETVNKRPTT